MLSVLRSSTSRVAVRALRASSGANFHSSARSNEVQKYYVHNPDDFAEKDENGNPKRDGLFHSLQLANPRVVFPLAAIFVGFPLVESGWYLVDEEALGAATFFLALSLARVHAGDMLYESMWEDAAETKKEFEAVEEYTIGRVQAALDAYKSITGMSEDLVHIYEGLVELQDKVEESKFYETQHLVTAAFIKELDDIVRDERELEETVSRAMADSVTKRVVSSFTSDAKLREASLDGSLAYLQSGEEGADALVQLYNKSLQDVRSKLDSLKGKQFAIPTEQEAATIKSLDELAKLPTEGRDSVELFPKYL